MLQSIDCLLALRTPTLAMRPVKAAKATPEVKADWRGLAGVMLLTSAKAAPPPKAATILHVSEKVEVFALGLHNAKGLASRRSQPYKLKSDGNGLGGCVTK